MLDAVATRWDLGDHAGLWRWKVGTHIRVLAHQQWVVAGMEKVPEANHRQRVIVPGGLYGLRVMSAWLVRIYIYPPGGREEDA